MNERLMGVFAPITTPFCEDGAVDYAGLEKNMAFYAKSGIKGYLALGSNGENKNLTNDEKEKVLKTIVRNKGKGQTVMAGCIFESTYETILYAKKFEKIGADFLTLLPPSYFKKQMTDPVLIKYFNDVANAVDTPCLLYNAPQFCAGTTLSTSLLKECANNKNIVGVKHIISAVLAACAGILFSTRLGSIGSDIGGDWMLFSFAAPLIGGTRMEGGRVDVVGAFLGGLLLAIVSNGVVHLQVNVYIVELLQGIIILIAVGLDRIRLLREEYRERMERTAI